MIRFLNKELHTDIQNMDINESVILDQKILINAKNCMMQKNCSVISVLDKKGQLSCFAFDDVDANREMRMLRELIENANALQFPDIYPEYRSVKIYGFNELAYSFANYLKMFGIAIEVEGEMWKNFYENEKYGQPEGKCLTIYADGVDGNKSSWMENLLTSVSVEFECIDHIYEANLKSNIISDVKETGEELVKRLKSEKEIVILGSGVEQLDVYNFLKGQGVDICCFMDESNAGHSMFGKQILNNSDVRKIYDNAIFINCESRHSAWGMGGVDYFDSIGYRRNERFWVFKDYFDITGDNLKNIMRSQKVALVGDLYLCKRLYAFLKNQNASVIGYMNVLQADIQSDLPEVSIKDIDVNTTCLLVVPELFNPDSRKKRKDEMEKLLKYIRDNHISNYTDYFSYTISFINIEAEGELKYTRDWIMPKHIVIGAIEGACGNTLFRELLDNHPKVMIISEYNYLNIDLMWICIRLSMESAENILPLFWACYGKESEQSIYDKKAFNYKMEQLLKENDRFTSQELFVMMHMSYMYMLGKDISDATDVIIYWEPHTVPRYILEESVRWLGTKRVSCDIVNIVRNICARNGSLIKECIREQWGEGYIFYRLALSYPGIDKRNYEYSGRVVIKFEDIKKHPKAILANLCTRWDIPWSDTLMMTTYHGKSSSYDNGESLVKDFDLEAVYKTYDEYFSEFDKFRLSLINAPWQRKYGYPYTDIQLFTRRELQQMFLREFYFERLEEFHKEKTDIQLRRKIQILIRKHLQQARIAEFYPE